MNDLKSKNAITLIALIITIIILLILAMVTIRILMNQGIIRHAQNATEAYSGAQNNETEYLTYAEGEMDKYAGATGGGGAGGDTYIPPAEDIDALKKYFMGTKEDGSINEEGQSLINVLDMETQDPNGFMGMFAFKDDENTIGSASNISMFQAAYPTAIEGKIYFYEYVRYKNKDDIYRVMCDEAYNVKDVAFVYSPQGEEGKTRIYKGEEWTVLYDKGDTLELVSPKIIGTITLGENGNIEKSIADYNNAVGILNEYCRDTLNDPTARSVGSNPNNPDSDNPGMYESENLALWVAGNYNKKGKKSDDNGEQDFVRMICHGVNVAHDTEGNITSYYLASRVCAEVESTLVAFDLKHIWDNGNAGFGKQLWDVRSNDNTNGYSHIEGVRACVTVAK